LARGGDGEAPAAIVSVALFIGATTACAGEDVWPDRATQNNPQAANVLADEGIRIWNATNDHAVARLMDMQADYEALAEEAEESSEQTPESSAAEAASYMRAADRIQQYIDAVCELSDTTVC
jgi:hypothetical protein